MKDYAERFWSKVERGDANSCWTWRGAQFGDGYGCVKRNGKNCKAHRIAMLLTHGELPDDKFVCHHIRDREARFVADGEEEDFDAGMILT